MALTAGLTAGLRAGLRAGLNAGGGVTTDGPDGVYVPASSADFTALGLPVPTSLWLCQEPSGTLVDTFGVAHMAPLGTGHLYSQPVVGWARSSVRNTETANQRWSNTTTAPDIGATSVLVIAYWVPPSAAPATTRRLAVLGGASQQITQILNTPLMRITTNGIPTNGVSNPCTGIAMPLVLYINRALGLNKVYTGQERLSTSDQTASLTGAEFHLGANTSVPPLQGWLWACMYTGADVDELGETSLASELAIKARLQTLGWSIPWL